MEPRVSGRRWGALETLPGHRDLPVLEPFTLIQMLARRTWGKTALKSFAWCGCHPLQDAEGKPQGRAAMSDVLVWAWGARTCWVLYIWPSTTLWYSPQQRRHLQR